MAGMRERPSEQEEPGAEPLDGYVQPSREAVEEAVRKMGEDIERLYRREQERRRSPMVCPYCGSAFLP